MRIMATVHLFPVSVKRENMNPEVAALESKLRRLLGEDSELFLAGTPDSSVDERPPSKFGGEDVIPILLEIHPAGSGLEIMSSISDVTQKSESRQTHSRTRKISKGTEEPDADEHPSEVTEEPDEEDYPPEVMRERDEEILAWNLDATSRSPIEMNMDSDVVMEDIFDQTKKITLKRSSSVLQRPAQIPLRES
ncbi:hypothetical protein JTB14_029272 [Gonioctena quinquepunctata]|nr:hypothetical protein JTB14_029272 [Gonioctena quinquepunctata]